MIDIIQEAHICNYYSLEESGIHDIAFPRQEALRVVQTCRILGISILGGDVYHKNDSAIELSYDNWYYDKNPVVSDLENIRQSCNRAERYIKNYHDHSGRVSLFTFVLDDGKSK